MRGGLQQPAVSPQRGNKRDRLSSPNGKDRNTTERRKGSYPGILDRDPLRPRPVGEVRPSGDPPGARRTGYKESDELVGETIHRGARVPQGEGP